MDSRGYLLIRGCGQLPVKAALLFFSLVVPVHEFYSQECCENKDCKPVACEEIISVDGGWMWRSIKFRFDMMKMAPDGNCHVCIATNAFHASANGPRCIYLPPRT